MSLDDLLWQAPAFETAEGGGTGWRSARSNRT
jgi:hypothetical protein